MFQYNQLLFVRKLRKIDLFVNMNYLLNVLQRSAKLQPAKPWVTKRVCAELQGCEWGVGRGEGGEKMSKLEGDVHRFEHRFEIVTSGCSFANCSKTLSN